MVNYNESKIYKIVSNFGDLVYVGSTTKKYLSSRLAQHISKYKSHKKGTYHKITAFQLFDAYEPENCEIILVENVNCNSKNELHARERYYIESMICVNKFIPLRKCTEYYQDNKERLLEQKKVYYEDNKEHKLQIQKVYYENNKDKINDKNVCLCGGKYSTRNKLRHFSSQKHINFTIAQYKKPLDPIPDLQESAII